MLRTGGGELSLSGLAFLLILIFLSAAITNLIGLFSIFGAFIMGAVLYDQHEFREAVSRRLRDFVTVFFLLALFLILASLVYTPGVRVELPVASDLPGTDKPTVKVALCAPSPVRK